MKKLKIAFDIDDTLWKVIAQFPFCNSSCNIINNECSQHRGKYRQVPDYEIIQVLKWFYDNDHEVYVWSAGGLDYAQTIVDKLGLTEMVTVIPKQNYDAKEIIDIDIAFDDMDTNLAKVDVKVKRDNHEVLK